MRLTSFFDGLISGGPETLDALRERVERAGADDVRAETLRRIEKGELPPEIAASVLACTDLEPVIPDLLRLLREESAPETVRITAFLLLGSAGFDLDSELKTMDPHFADAVLADADTRAVAL